MRYSLSPTGTSLRRPSAALLTFWDAPSGTLAARRERAPSSRHVRHLPLPTAGVDAAPWSVPEIGDQRQSSTSQVPGRL